MQPAPHPARRSWTAAAALLAVAGFVVSAAVLPAAIATHQPANKMAVAASSLEKMSAPLVDGESSVVHDLLSGTMKTSRPTDLVLTLTAECALFTDITATEDTDSEAVAKVTVWVEMDGAPVAVSGDEDPASPDLGRVVFCNRAHGMTITNLDDDDAEFQNYLRTRAANAFQWVVLDAGSGLHAFVVKAQLDVQVTGVGDAEAFVGKRTLTVQPEKLANDAAI